MTRAQDRRTPAILGAMLLVCAGAAAQTTGATPPTPEEEGEATGWSFSASVYTYLLPDDEDYAQPTVTADRDGLHLETRYNYEGLDTGSAWLGFNVSVGKAVALDLTPMIGGVFGSTTGIAPGYRLSLRYRKLELTSEGEYLFDLGDRSDSFLYNWSELTLAPAEWLRVGLVTQRTRAYQSDLEIQRGFLVGFSRGSAYFTAYVFNLGWEDPTVVVSVAVEF